MKNIYLCAKIKTYNENYAVGQRERMLKFYAAKGEENKIFTSWEECKNFLDGKKGYKYKGFATRAEAEAFLSGENYYEKCVDDDLKRGYAVAYTDGSYEESVNAYSYGALLFTPDGKKEELSGKGNKPEFLPSRNIAGEAEGALAAIKQAFINGCPKLKIYHDYSGLGAWARGEWGAKSPISSYYKKQFDRYAKAIRVEFVQVKGHANNEYNEAVDRLAKAALFENKILSVNGTGFAISGTDEANYLCKKIHALYSAAKYEFTKDGTVFYVKLEKLGIYTRNGVTVVAGDGDEAYFVAVAELLKKRGGVERAQLIERAFDVDVLDGVRGVDISRALLKSRKYYPSLCVVFALDFVAESILERLRYFGQKLSRISAAFNKNRETGEFEMTIRVPGEEELLRAYNFLYKYRLGFAGLDLDYEKAEALVDECEKIVKFKVKGFYG